MKINLMLFISSVKEPSESETLIKTFESTIRPVEGDIIDDPGFDPGFHNGYEIIKVTINYASDECWVSLAPLAIEKEEIKIGTYLEKLKNNGWRAVSNEELQSTL
ncbi:hypothetical protein [Halobacillus naozhouensis]|uniref:Immunity protein 8 n=1 Tax=Halobacillus naozhouensis TaxID=554880 RepID=A0ABY8J018_9BACI|nr:hypothetical protein [Halobacillus naozhouensis]WFT75670.1 hypothetical protein P9989_04580 [Halobacillus naozhouensis]